MNTPPNDDSELRRLLDDAVSDVHPGEGMDRIRDRTQHRVARPSSAARWIPVTVAAALATVLVIAGAAWLGRTQSPPAAGPGTSDGATSGEPASQPARAVDVTVYYVGDTAAGPRLFSEQHTVPNATGSDLQAAITEAVTSPPRDADYENLFLGLGVDATATTDGNATTIDLAAPLSAPPGMKPALAQMALQALAWTADSVSSGAGPVTFTVAGAPADQVLGVDTTTAVQRASADSALATVSISSPSEGAVVGTTFTVKGQAATFEANVVWELEAAGKVVQQGFTTAGECCTLSPYEFTVTAEPGEYTLVVHDTDMSDGEGVGTSQDTKQITVQ